MTASLDPRDARPLTSREISKVLHSILQGIAVSSPATKDSFLDLAVRARQYLNLWYASPHSSELADPAAPFEQITDALSVACGGITASWQLAFVATVSGFISWCRRGAIDQALVWLTENMSRLFPAPAVPKEN